LRYLQAFGKMIVLQLFLDSLKVADRQKLTASSEDACRSESKSWTTTAVGFTQPAKPQA
jgi:hypothetical protein